MPYGVALVDAHGARGYADWGRTDHLEPFRISIPAPGTRLRAVIIGYTANERFRATTRRMDVRLAESVDDMHHAAWQWRAVHSLDDFDKKSLNDLFFAHSNAVPLLRWALAHHPDSPNWKTGTKILGLAPEEVRRAVRAGFATPGRRPVPRPTPGVHGRR